MKKETNYVNIPDEYIEKGFKPIGNQLVLNRFGVVINVITGKVVSQRKDSLGFMAVRLMDRRKYRYIHRLVAELFIPNPLHYPNIRHINGDRTDNRAENLRWATPSENNYNKHTRETAQIIFQQRGFPLVRLKNGYMISIQIAI